MKTFRKRWLTSNPDARKGLARDFFTFIYFLEHKGRPDRQAIHLADPKVKLSGRGPAVPIVPRVPDRGAIPLSHEALAII
jgi:hypothetical protein